ncbi:hypothetical protein BpsS140_00039 [Bacillus phage vB_BpsS-140]|nr:hypothetical protein BpsS140_00039 [Bacillus phage vB_BpsS-140]
MLIYSAGAIDLNEGTDTHELVSKTAKHYRIGVNIFNPRGAFSLSAQGLHSKEDAKILVDINKHALKSCHGVLFVIDKHTPSIGTPMELYFAHSQGIPKKVLYIKSNSNDPIPQYILAHIDDISSDVIIAIAGIDSLNNAIKLTMDKLVQEIMNNNKGE